MDELARKEYERRRGEPVSWQRWEEERDEWYASFIDQGLVGIY